MIVQPASALGKLKPVSIDVKEECCPLRFLHRSLAVRTEKRLEFIDLTDRILEEVRRASILFGLVNIQTLHTTAAIFVNENEPLLLDDLKQFLDQLAPGDRYYRHNDFSIRTHNILPGEDRNGHSHCKALLLRTSETLNVANGALQLGPWQRIFLAELDKPRDRTVSLLIMGQGRLI